MRFNEVDNLAVITCTHVIYDNKPIVLVSHDDDGDWQFLCDKGEHKSEEGILVSLKEIVMLDESLNNVANLPLNSETYRKDKNSEWKKLTS